MLKFEFDEEKQKIFLTFWKIKSLSQFKELIASPKRFFLRLCLLEDISLRTLGILIKDKLIPQIKNTISIEPGNNDRQLLPQFSLLEIDNLKEILEMLDSINAINLWGKNSKHYSKEGTESKFIHPLNTTNRSSIKNNQNGEDLSNELEALLENCSFTQEFEDFFTGFFKTSIDNKKNNTEANNQQNIKDNISKLNLKTKKVFKHFIQYHGFIGNQILPHHPEEDLLSLEKQGLIDFHFLAENFLPAVSLNGNTAQAIFNPINASEKSSKTDSSLTSFTKTKAMPQPFPSENLAEALFFIQIAMFEEITQTNLGKFYPTSTAGVTKKKFLTDIFNSLIEKKELPVYQNLNFYKKVELLLKNYLPESYQLVKSLCAYINPSLYPNIQNGDNVQEESLMASQEIQNFIRLVFPLGISTELYRGIEEDKLIYLFAFLFFTDRIQNQTLQYPQRSQYPQNQEPPSPVTLAQEKVLKAIEPLLHLGLVMKTKNVYYFQTKVIEQLFQDSTNSPIPTEVVSSLPPGSSSIKPDNLKSAQLVIDSDYSIIATKTDLEAEDIFFLYHFCKLNISTHLIRGSLDTERSPIAWFYHYKTSHLVKFFSVRAKTTFSKNFQDVLELYFEHCPYFAKNQTIKVTTESKNFFLMFKYFLENHELTDTVTILEEQKTIIFHDLKHYEKVVSLFPDPPPIKLLNGFTDENYFLPKSDSENKLYFNANSPE